MGFMPFSKQSTNIFLNIIKNICNSDMVYFLFDTNGDYKYYLEEFYHSNNEVSYTYEVFPQNFF